MDLEDLEQQEYFVVNRIFDDGSKSVHGINLDKTHILTKQQLKTVKAYLKKRGFGLEIYKVSVKLGERIQ